LGIPNTSKTRNLCTQAGNVHLFSRDLLRLGINRAHLQLTLSGHTHPVAQAGLGNTQHLGHHRLRLPGTDLLEQLQ